MRITIVTGPWLPVPAVRGGSVGRMWEGLAREFARRGNSVTVVARRFNGQPIRESLSGVQYVRTGGAQQSRSIYLDLVKDLAYALRVFPSLPSADILVTNDFWLPVFAQFRRAAGAVVVSANRYAKGQYHLYRSVARIIAASRAIAKAITDQTPVVRSKVRCIPNPLDTNIFRPEMEDGLVRKRCTILYVGRVHPEKGVHVLISAFSLVVQKFPDSSLRIVGPTEASQGGGGEQYFNRLQSEASGLPIIFSPPEFNPEKLAHIYREAEIFCYPSLAERGEAFGVAAVEAMSCGLPIVVSKLDCFREFLVEGENGLSFDHRRADHARALAEKLETALSDRPRLLRMGQAAHRSADRFAFPNVAEQFLSEFHSVLAERPRRNLSSDARPSEVS